MVGNFRDKTVGCMAPSVSSPLACHSCQSSFMSLSSQAHKISFWFNAKLMQGVSNMMKEERKEKSKRKGSFGYGRAEEKKLVEWLAFIVT